MKTAFQFLSAAFRLLILKPFDFLLFGGAGVLTIPRAEWQKMIQNDIRSAGPYKAQSLANDKDNYDGVDDRSHLPKWLTTDLPTVYDSPEGESFFMSIEK